MAEARQGHRRSRAAPLGQRLVQAHGAEDYPGYHVARQNPGRGQLGPIDQYLPDGAKHAAAQERVQIIHEKTSLFR